MDKEEIRDLSVYVIGFILFFASPFLIMMIFFPDHPNTIGLYQWLGIKTENSNNNSTQNSNKKISIYESPDHANIDYNSPEGRALAALGQVNNELTERKTKAGELLAHCRSKINDFEIGIMEIKKEYNNNLISKDEANHKIENRIQNIATYTKRIEDIQIFIRLANLQIDNNETAINELDAFVRHVQVVGNEQEMAKLSAQITQINEKIIPMSKNLIYRETDVSAAELRYIQSVMRQKYSL